MTLVFKVGDIAKILQDRINKDGADVGLTEVADGYRIFQTVGAVQAIFDAWLSEQCDPIFGRLEINGTFTAPADITTHQAILVDIKPIEKKCVHHAMSHTILVGGREIYNTLCCHCGVKLRPTGWEEVK